ncbi:MAG: peptide-methionine (S)-S-oxide reductase MsrA [Alphaproteobacteria bacterium]
MKNLFTTLAAVVVAYTATSAHAQELETAIFAGGCFWCVESDFDAISGVVETVSGYTGGIMPNPTYKSVSAGGTRHREAVQITFDPDIVSYEQLLTAFWHSVDPTDAGGQFCDRGESYTTAVFVNDELQRQLAETSKRETEALLGMTVATTIEAATPFFPAEDYHQDYRQNNPLRYRFYRWNCGRNQRVEELWGDRAYAGIPGHG